MGKGRGGEGGWVEWTVFGLVVLVTCSFLRIARRLLRSEAYLSFNFVTAHHAE